MYKIYSFAEGYLIGDSGKKIKSAVIKMKITLLCLLNTCLMATGQILFKTGSSGKEINSLLSLIKLFFNPIIILALFLYAGTTGLWLYILNKASLSFAYPIQALAFPLVLAASIFFFNESVSLTRWIGVGIICVGVFIATR